MSHISTHVLDAATGRPAPGMTILLETHAGDVLAKGETDADGRVSALGPETLPPGGYRLLFETGAWFALAERETFYPRVTIEFEVAADSGHYHVPLLLSPFAYSTYRGS